MNVFYLDEDPMKCAKYHFDAHINKLLLESTQMLSTALWCVDPLIAEDYFSIERCYAPISNINHPSAVWTRKSTAHFIWLKNLTLYLNEEKKYRFGGKDHKSYFVATNLPIPDIENHKFTQPPQCMPEYLFHYDSVIAYRNYYMSDEKRYMATWTKRKRPEWWIR